MKEIASFLLGIAEFLVSAIGVVIAFAVIAVFMIMVFLMMASIFAVPLFIVLNCLGCALNFKFALGIGAAIILILAVFS